MRKTTTRIAEGLGRTRPRTRQIRSRLYRQWLNDVSEVAAALKLPPRECKEFVEAVGVHPYYQDRLLREVMWVE